MNCPQCNAPLPADAPTGLCPACLLKRGLEPNTIPPTIPAGSEWTPPTPEQLAPFFPDLDLLSLLGRGGMGAVYKARQKSLDRIVALKILPPQLATDPSFPERFTHEAQALARLNHPHIVTIYDFGMREFPVSSGQFQEKATLATGNPNVETLHFLLMEYIDGLSLRELLNASRLDPAAALAIVPQICDALQYAHDRGIVHRDIKPENILLTKSGQIKIADFGLAKLITPSQDSGLSTQDSHIAGTPAYMAPEQSAAPETVDHRADIYALGVVFYQMLTGELPSAGNFAAPSKKVHIDIRLDEIVLRALEKSPGLRYQSATDFKTQIETVLSTPAASHAPPPPIEPSEPRPAMGGIGSDSPTKVPSLHAASLFLRIVAAIHIVLFSWPLLIIVAVPFRLGGISVGDLFVACVVLVMFAANLFIFRAGRNMAEGRHYRQTIAGAALSMLFGPLGLAAGIWCLVLLLRPETRAAFDSPQGSPAAAARASVLSSPSPPSRASTQSFLYTVLLHLFLAITAISFFCYVVPQFLSLFRDFHVTLPALTHWTVELSSFVTGRGGYLLITAFFFFDVGICFLLNHLLGRLALRIWSILALAASAFILGMSALSLALPIGSLVTPAPIPAEPLAPPAPAASKKNPFHPDLVPRSASK